MKSFLDCWIGTATALFAQALAGEPQLSESLPKPLAPDSFGFAATVSGDETGRFAVVLDGTILAAPLLGEGVDQKAGWGELLREVAESAVGELLASTGKKCRIEKFDPTEGESKVSRAFQLKAGDRTWTILVRDEVRAPKPAAKPEPPPAPAKPVATAEMPLSEILDLGPGDVVQLDRHIADPVDLIVGDKIVARGEVVLIKGNFGLRITEVAAPRKRLESIRCLF